MQPIRLGVASSGRAQPARGLMGQSTLMRNEKAMLKTFASAAVVSAAALALGLTAPANADLYGIDDPQDTFHGSDLRAVQLKNGHSNVVVTTYHSNLRRDPATGSAGSVYLDTDRRDRGPEFVFVGGYVSGTDYRLLHTEGFGRNKWGAPADGSHELTVDYAKEAVRMRMSRQPFDKPGKVRVAVRIVGTRTDGTSTGLVDWLGKRASFTPWLAKG